MTGCNLLDFGTPARKNGKRLPCEVLQAENARLRDLMYERAHVHAIQHMTEDELRITAANVMEEHAKLRELAQRADILLTDLFPYIDYSRCTALEAAAAWRVRARELGVGVEE